MFNLGETRSVQSSLRRFGCSLIVAFLFASLGVGQKTASDPFAHIPASARTRLIERLNLLVEYQRDGRWSKQFDLLTDLYLQGDNKDTYVRNKKRYRAEGVDNRLVEFVPRSASGPNQLIDGGQWQIFGCGRWLEDNKTVKYDASVIAVREKGDWYFSEVSIITSVGGPAEPCPN